MTSAVLSRNESYCGGRKVYMRNHTPHFTRFNPNLNPNSNPSANFYLIQNPNPNLSRNLHQPPAPVAALVATPAVGKYQRTVMLNDGKEYVTYHVDNFTRNDLKMLRNQLSSELEAVRRLQTRIESRSGRKRAMPALPGRVIKRAAVSDPMKKCKQILMKVMKHKHAWVFSKPVDAIGLRLFDYHQIIKHPMDLGTVKSKLERNEYESPVDFADDVRLTFRNALSYNGEGDDAHKMADGLLLMFNQMFHPVSEKLEVKVHHHEQVSGKRVMSYSEKESLGRSLQELQPESMEEFMSIVRRSNCQVDRDGDEIELDIEVMDEDLLWELQRFVNNQKKIPVKKEEEDTVINIPESPVLQINKADVTEEDVDIGEEILMTDFPLVEIRRSTSSSSDCSSSSDSGSSSGSDEDEDGGNSPLLEVEK